MTGKELDYIRATVDNEGFDYAFRHYSEFENVKDKKFHQLRKAYLRAAEALQEYLGEWEEV